MITITRGAEHVNVQINIKVYWSTCGRDIISYVCVEGMPGFVCGEGVWIVYILA